MIPLNLSTSMVLPQLFVGHVDPTKGPEPLGRIFGGLGKILWILGGPLGGCWWDIGGILGVDLGEMMACLSWAHSVYCSA